MSQKLFMSGLDGLPLNLLSDRTVRVRISKKSGQAYMRPIIPVFSVRSDGKKGMMFRHCSQDAKIAPLHSKGKEIAGRGNKFISWIGMSTDEVVRVKDSTDKRIINRWPLIESNMSRSDCLKWMESKGYPKPPRSACIYCPYHNDSEWVRIRKESEEEFQFAVAFEKRLQESYKQCTRLDSVPFLHASRKPLSEVVFNPTEKTDGFQMQLPCEGMCGV